MFFVIKTTNLDANDLLEEINSFYPALKFTLELPTDNQIAFLDFCINHSEGNFHYKLYSKPSDSGCILPFTSAIPENVKRGVVVGEFRRAANRSSNDSAKKESMSKVLSRFISNGYPPLFVEKTLARNDRKKEDKSDFGSSYFIKIPFLNDFYHKRFYSILHNLGLHKCIKSYCKNRNLFRFLAPKKQMLYCESSCNFCPIMRREFSCMQKFLIYGVECVICKKTYIEQTARFLKTLIHEHFTNDSSAIKKHYYEHIPQTDIYNFFSVYIIHTNLRNSQQRLYVESEYIRENRHSLMNGCVSVL